MRMQRFNKEDSASSCSTCGEAKRGQLEQMFSPIFDPWSSRNFNEAQKICLLTNMYIYPHDQKDLNILLNYP